MRILKLIIIPVLIMTMVIFPISIGFKTDVKALTNDEIVALYPAAFWAWQAAQWGSMGLQVQSLGDALDYVNRNGTLDDYLANAWSRFTNEVDKVVRVADTYFKFTGSFWKEIFTGEEGTLTGLKQMFAGSVDPESEFYLDESTASINYANYKVLFLDNTHFGNYLSQYGDWNTSSYTTTQLLFINEYCTSSLEINGKLYYWNNSTDRYNFYEKDINSGTTELIYGANKPGGFFYEYYGIFLAIYWINADGVPDANGNVYQAHIVPIRHYSYRPLPADPDYVYYNYNWSGANYLNTKRFVVNESDIEWLQSVTFDAEKLAKEVTDDDVVGGSVEIAIGKDYVSDVEEAILAINSGIKTAYDISMPQAKDYAISTDIPAVADVVGVVPKAVTGDISIEFPQVEQFTLPNLITTKFPFSIPWDIQRAFQMFEATPVVPHFVIPFNFARLNINESIEIDLQQFSLLAKIFRWFTLASFILALALVTRGLIKG
jgi:hypothetical protein